MNSTHASSRISITTAAIMTKHNHIDQITRQLNSNEQHARKQSQQQNYGSYHVNKMGFIINDTVTFWLKRLSLKVCTRGLGVW